MSNSDKDNIADSWIEVDFSQCGDNPSMHASLDDSVMSKLLRDAQDGSGSRSAACSGSRASQGTPPSPPPSREENGGYAESKTVLTAEWALGLASRPEISGSPQMKITAPISRGYSIRNSSIVKGENWIVNNLPVLIATHTCVFILGAATVFIIMKRYSKSVTVN